MWDRTDCELSAGRATIDLEAMVDVANLAFGKAFQNVEQLQREMYDLPYGEDNGLRRQSIAERVAKEAEHMALAAELLHALEGTKTRENLIIVNHEVEDRAKERK